MIYDVIVIGGGIIGALSAYEMANAGLKVLLLEKTTFGLGASGNSAAMLELQLDASRGEPFLSLARASHDLFPAINAELAQKSGIDFHFQRCSILQIALTQAEAADLKRECERQCATGLPAVWMSSKEVQQRLPALTPNHFGGALYTDDGQVNGGLFLHAALEAARRGGATVKAEAGDVRITDCLKQAKRIVVAAGAWTDLVLKDIGIQLGITPVRGQLLVYDTPTPVLPFPVYTKTGGYLTPKQDGSTLAGTTVENVGFDTTTTNQGREHIISMVKELMPSLLDRPIIRATAGLRPRSPDDLPLIGPLPDHPNVLIAAGHYRNGVLLAPITAKIIAALVQDRAPAVPIQPFLPSRVYSKA